MRVLFCKIHCPSFICFCKSTSHIYTPGPLKLENTPHVPSTETVADDDHQFVCGDADEETRRDKDENLVVNGKRQQHQVEEEEREGGGQEEEESEFCPRSSLKKFNLELEQQPRKKKVQWMDLLGKDLVEIKEFEARFVLFLLFLF